MTKLKEIKNNVKNNKGWKTNETKTKEKVQELHVRNSEFEHVVRIKF